MLQQVSRPLAMMNGVESFTRWKMQAAEQGQPGILQPWCIDLHLLADGCVSRAEVRAPVQVSAVQKDERGRFGWLV